jgi:6-phosphofructo-2-kinase/fructose-2,6-biphosphatase 2
MTRSGVKEDHTASYFNHDNAEANRRREQLAHESLEMLIQWLKDGGNVGIHGTGSAVVLLLNSREARRYE